MCFNQVIGVDLLEAKYSDKTRTVLNVVCWGTGYQHAEIPKSKESAEVTKGFARVWARHYSVPELIVYSNSKLSVKMNIILDMIVTFLASTQSIKYF